MTDWTRGMQQSYEYWEVDPRTWLDTEQLDTVTACDATRDAETDKIESAKITIDSDLSGETYVRCYLVTTQDGETEKFCLGTWLAQSPETDYDGKVITRSVTCYGPLQELADDMPAIGYPVDKDSDIRQAVYNIARTHCRAPISKPSTGKTLSEAFVANDGDSWLKFSKDLLEKDSCHFVEDAYGRLSVAPDTEPGSLTPVWEYDDGNSSILESDVTDTGDWYGIPNVVEVVVSKNDTTIKGVAKNDDPNSVLSTVSRGRVVKKRVTDAKLGDTPSQASVENYAKKVLLDESQLEHKITYTHAYNEVKLGDGVSLNYSRHGLKVDRAKVVRQEFNCDTGLSVKETAVYMESLWNG